MIENNEEFNKIIEICEKNMRIGTALDGITKRLYLNKENIKQELKEKELLHQKNYHEQFMHKIYYYILAAEGMSRDNLIELRELHCKAMEEKND